MAVLAVDWMAELLLAVASMLVVVPRFNLLDVALGRLSLCGLVGGSVVSCRLVEDPAWDFLRRTTSSWGGVSWVSPGETERVVTGGL